MTRVSRVSPQRTGRRERTPQHSTALARTASSTGSSGARCACGGGCPRCAGPHSRPGARGSGGARIQAKLQVGSPRDEYEQQADRIAADVMTLASPRAAGVRPFVAGQKVSVEGAEALERQLDAGTHAGRPLPDDVRVFMEPRFMADFGEVRVHTGGEASEMNGALHARAFAHGTHIYYGDGRAPANDALTAHELTHVVQQGGANQPGLVQTSPDDDPYAEAEEEERTEKLIQEGSDEIDKEGGTAKFHYAPAELDDSGLFVLFDEFAVHRLFRYLLERLLGATGWSDSLEISRGSTPPAWVGEFRARALNVRKPRDYKYALPSYRKSLENPAYEEDKRLADLAIKLADSVAAETPAQKVRRQMIEEIDKRIGTTVMSKEAIAAERNKQASGGYTPQNFTTCIEFFGQVTRAVTQQSGASKPLLQGPNAYLEINPKADPPLTLPPGSWHPCSGGGRPKPGDLIIFRYSENEYTKEHTVAHAQGEFAHVSILRSIEPIRDDAGEVSSDPREKWVSIDGGGSTAMEVARYFSPDTCLIQGPGTIMRKLHGWIDVEKAAEPVLAKP